MMCIDTPNKVLIVLFINSVCVKVIAEKIAWKSFAIVEDLIQNYVAHNQHENASQKGATVGYEEQLIRFSGW